jgi:NADP-dependent 3-hydroxy acid dehydrogenase YdfG
MRHAVQDNVVLITGASSGIGETTALALSEAGAKVAVGARRTDRLADLAKRAPGEVLALELDVTDEQSCRAAVAATVERFGALDVLVNNAGLMLSGPILGADTTEWTRMVRTNLLGTMYTTHAALPHLLQSKGTVVQVSSTSGRVASAGGGVYAATKFGVNVLRGPAQRSHRTGRTRSADRTRIRGHRAGQSHHRPRDAGRRP